MCVLAQTAEWMEVEFSVRTDAEYQHVAVWCPLLAAVRRAGVAGAHKHILTHKTTLIYT